MTKIRPFRFAVQAHHAGGAHEWRETARKVESMGYSTLYVPDHFTDLPGPIAALMAAADATTTLRVGSLVFDNDYRHPVVLAKEAATIDLLSGGRLDLGLGAGWQTSDYERSGIAHDSVGTRIERMEEALKVIKGLMAAGAFSFSGKHYRIDDLDGRPKPLQKPHPPILLGGGGRRMMRIAGREADIVNINFNLSEGHINPTLVRTGMASATDEKIGWIREGAGERFAGVELSVTIFRVSVTEDRDSIAEAFAPALGIQPADVLEIPHVLAGTVDQIVTDLQTRRQRYGISYVIVPEDFAEELAPVVERLVGT